MQRTPWSMQQQKQCKQVTGQAMHCDSTWLDSVNHDFSRLYQGHAVCVAAPTDLSSLQSLLQYANQHQLPVTLRGQGLSQSGQSLAVDGGMSLDLRQLNTAVYWEGDCLVAGCGASWRDIVRLAFERGLIPYVYPYNLNLTLGGVLSVGGLGASTFKVGIAAAYVQSMEVITANGALIRCDATQDSDLFYACLGGTGLFGVIYSAVLCLRTRQEQIWQGMLHYHDHAQWIQDQFLLRRSVDYLEAFVSNTDSSLFCTQIAVEYTKEVPPLDFIEALHGELVLEDTLSLLDYTERHEPRLQHMKASGLWDGFHPWYECYLGAEVLIEHFLSLRACVEEGFDSVCHVFPVAPIRPPYFMLPDVANPVTFNLLTPGLNDRNLSDALHALQQVDKRLQSLGGKRYVSGWFFLPVDAHYWMNHYGAYYQERQRIKAVYDPKHIFCSQLFCEKF